jgi:F-type H+-transporting ATPase subunit delta
MITSGSHLKYAKALSKVVAKNDAAEAVLRDLESLTQIFREEQFKKSLKKIAYMERSALAEIIKKTFADRVHPVTMNLLVMLAGNRKLSILPKILEAYARAYNEEKGIRAVTVCAARKLDSEEELAIIEKLQSKFDKPVSAKFTINADLIGGMQIYERGHMTDCSVKGYLEIIEKTLMETEI